ncbi:N-terminal glutamine amidase-domain-containing protein [Lipomyces tetrasporus]|uniref:Protein N-terminal glutamine amidohydrolase n=1 Tax=Lipomyces tetrasporus TaxID=54092 RepID=A0AAD7VTI6_9ASCO|nr:N-terminal glutamine amidase-domain-containing protein [Lipomyces tetrasporus]KAJ8100779.1 N-terminal glutamine amidase-domain-containing protein [Lipomyces tetrasporus]
MELPYSSCYCEENIYEALEILQSQCTGAGDCSLYSVFISSPTRAVPLFCQRSSPREDGQVIWDYHVVLLKVVKDMTYVLDFDTTIQADNEQLNVRDGLRRVEFLQFGEYAELTFRPSLSLPKNLQRNFRIIAAEDYLSSFASDRSHMLAPAETTQQQVYVNAPPPWPQICGANAAAAGVRMNIDSFIDVKLDSSKLNRQHVLESQGMRFGEVLNQEQFLDRFLFLPRLALT